MDAPTVGDLIDHLAVLIELAAEQLRPCRRHPLGRLGDDAGQRLAEQPLSSQVGIDHPAAQVQDHHPIANRLKDPAARDRPQVK